MPTASTAATASSTLPGPTGSPAARKVRPKCIRLATSRPSAPSPTLPRLRGRESAASAAGGSGLTGTGSRLARGGGDLGLDLIEELGRLAALDAGDVVLVFEQHAQGVVDRLRRQFQHVELHQGLSPVDRLGDAGQFEEIHLAQFLHELDNLPRQGLAGA